MWDLLYSVFDCIASLVKIKTERIGTRASCEWLFNRFAHSAGAWQGANFEIAVGTTFEIAVYSLSKLQFTRFRGATFEIAVYSFSPPKPFPIDQHHPKMLPHNPTNIPKMVPKTFEIKQKLSRAAKTRKERKKEAGLNDCKGLGPHFCDL